MFQRTDVDATTQERYLLELKERAAPLRARPWSSLSQEEKETVTELLALQAGLVSAPGS